MKIKPSVLWKLLIFAMPLAACGHAITVAPSATVVPSPTVAPSPTAAPSPTIVASPTNALSPTANPSLTADMATITFENKKCTYAGPRPIPAGHSIMVNWVVKNKDREKYGLYVFTLKDGKTIEDLRKAANDPNPPSWAPIAGFADSTPNSSQPVPVNTEIGPLYFTCWFSPPDTMFQIIGPIEVSGTNP